MSKLLILSLLLFTSCAHKPEPIRYSNPSAKKECNKQMAGLIKECYEYFKGNKNGK